MGQPSSTDSHAAGAHPDFLQHHFDTPEQQFDSGKLGMWLFLATEILLFGGLFCAYAVYRGNHPEVFTYAHQFLDWKLGAINTVVLLCSSLTMAWAVRASQLGQQRLLIVLLCLTLLGGFGFMGIKFVEYKAKFEHGTLWAKKYQPQNVPHDGGHGAEHTDDHADPGAVEGAPPEVTEVAAASESSSGFKIERSMLPAAAAEPAGVVTEREDHAAGGHALVEREPDKVQVFFSIYFLMTGLHGLHVIAGMAAIAWIMFKALGGAFSPKYFTPVDLVGLYWHLVDLIWIFLFPLLYLIH